MDQLQVLVLTTAGREDADHALDEIKRLERAGWIELTDYALLGLDSQSVVRVHESAGAVGLENAANAWAWTQPLVASLNSAGHFALAVVTAERYAERVAEEMESRGHMVRRHLRGAECQVVLHGAVEREKMNVRWLQGVLRNEVEKAARLAGIEREEIESTIAAGRAELGAEREILQSRLRTLAASLDAELSEKRDQLSDAEGEIRASILRRVEEIDRALAACHQDLIVSILDHMDALAGHASELQVKAAKASPEAADVIEAQLHEVQVRVRKYRAELTATLGLSSARVRQCMDHLRLAAALESESKPEIEERLNNLEESHQTVKADVRRLEKEGSRVWHELAGDFRHSWQALCESVGRAERGYR
jgi:hypothetical protein